MQYIVLICINSYYNLFAPGSLQRVVQESRDCVSGLSGLEVSKCSKSRSIDSIASIVFTYSLHLLALLCSQKFLSPPGQLLDTPDNGM